MFQQFEHLIRHGVRSHLDGYGDGYRNGESRRRHDVDDEGRRHDERPKRIG